MASRLCLQCHKQRGRTVVVVIERGARREASVLFVCDECWGIFDAMLDTVRVATQMPFDATITGAVIRSVRED